MRPQEVLTETIVDGIATLTLNRPNSLNALSDPLFDSIREAFERLDAHSGVGVIVLTGNGRAFCAGGDVNSMPDNSRKAALDTRITALQRRAASVQAINNTNKLTIASINGIAYGAGLSLALACDFRIACRSATLVSGYLNMALSGDCGLIHLLTRLLGEAKAKELFFLPDPLTAEEALRVGLITQCVDDDDLVAESLSLARRLEAGPWTAQRYAKRNFRNTRLPLSDYIATESAYLVLSANSEDHAEAKVAFHQKRQPLFKNKGN